MKKIFDKKVIFSFILGIILCGGIVYGTNLYKSEDIKYDSTDSSWEVSNVKDAINSLYSIKNELESLKSLGDAEAAQILSGRTALVQGKLVTGTLTIQNSTPRIVASSQKNDSSSSSYTVTSNGYAILHGAGTADSISVKIYRNGTIITSGSKQAYTVVQVNAGDSLQVVVTCSGGTKTSATMIAVV